MKTFPRRPPPHFLHGEREPVAPAQAQRRGGCVAPEPLFRGIMNRLTTLLLRAVGGTILVVLSLALAAPAWAQTTDLVLTDAATGGGE